MQRFFKRDQNVGFDIRSALCGCFASAESTECRAAAAAAEKSFEKIAEPSPTEFKLHAAATVTTPLIKSSTGLTAPLRRRLESARLVPVGAELIVFLALLRVAQDFVGFIDLLKFFFGGFFVLGDVRMIFPRQFPKRASDLIVRRRFGNAECFVIISELHRHRASTLCRRSIRATFSVMRELGKFLVMIGAVVVMLGAILWSGFAPKWLGHLPGDIRIEREHSAFYFPIVTCIIISIVLSLLFSIFRR